jgi:hypothetical protein
MGSFGTLYPTSIEGTTGTAWSNQDVNRVNKGINTPDGLAITSGVNSTSTISFRFNIPPNILYVDSTTVRMRVRVSSLVDDTQIMFVRMQASNGTNLTDEVTVLQRTSPIGYDTYTMNMPIIANPATYHLWNNARLVVRTLHSANMGSDGSFWDIDEVELTGSFVRIPSITNLITPTNGQTGVAAGRTTFQFGITTEPGFQTVSEIEIDTVPTFDSQAGTAVAEYAFSNADAVSVMQTGGTVFIGQSFRGVTGDPVSKVRVLLSKLGSPTGLIDCSIRNHSGSFGAATPGTTIHGTSLPIDIATLTTTPTVIEFTFQTPITITTGTNYFFVLNLSSVFSNADNNVRVGVDSSTPTAEGNMALNNGSWGYSPTTDMVFDINSTRRPFLTEASNSVPTGFTYSDVDSNTTQGYIVPQALELGPNTTYYWRLRGRYTSGSYSYFSPYQYYSFTTTSAGGFSGGTLKRWNGSGWVSAKLKRWNGSIFSNNTLKRWNGSMWVSVNTN